MGLIIALIFGIVCAVIAHAKGRSAVGWFFIGFLLSLIGFILVLVVSDKEAEKRKQDALQREQRRLREQLKQERMKNRAFQQHTQARLDAHDGALQMNTREVGPKEEKVPLIGEKETRAFETADLADGAQQNLEAGWYVNQDGQNRGPMSRTDLCRLHSYNEVDGDSQVWHPALENWDVLRNVREMLGIKSA